MNDAGIKKIKLKIGDVFAIPLGDEFFGYCRIIDQENCEFYSVRTNGMVDIGEIFNFPVSFTISVMRQQMELGDWPRVGNIPLSGRPAPTPRFFHQSVGSDEIEIYENGDFRSASREEANGLERLAAWDSGHVVDRLQDMFEGRSNVWVQSLKLK